MNTPPPLVIDQAGVVQPSTTLASVLSRVGSTGYRLEQLVSAWLAQHPDSPDTLDAYGRDIRQYLRWCAEHQFDPLAVRFPEASIWVGTLAQMTGPGSKPYAKRTRNRKVAAATSFYDYLLIAQEVTVNPFRGQKRAKVEGGRSNTNPISADSAAAMLDEIHETGYRNMPTECAELVLELLAGLGVRVSEVCKLDLVDLGPDELTITCRLKGGKVRVKAVPAELRDALAAWLAVRPQYVTEASGNALLLRKDGRRIDRFQVDRLVKKAARLAGVKVKVSPHSLRHGWNDTAKGENVPLDDRREGLGHSSSDTTQIYDHTSTPLEQDPSHVVARRVHASRRKDVR